MYADRSRLSMRPLHHPTYVALFYNYNVSIPTAFVCARPRALGALSIALLYAFLVLSSDLGDHLIAQKIGAFSTCDLRTYIATLINKERRQCYVVK